MCFGERKEPTGSKSVSGKPTESNYSQSCDISLQRTWKTRAHSHVHQLCVGLYVPQWLTRRWPHHGQGSLCPPNRKTVRNSVWCPLIIVRDRQTFSHDYNGGQTKATSLTVFNLWRCSYIKCYILTCVKALKVQYYTHFQIFISFIMDSSGAASYN